MCWKEAFVAACLTLAVATVTLLAAGVIIRAATVLPGFCFSWTAVAAVWLILTLAALAWLIRRR